MIANEIYGRTLWTFGEAEMIPFTSREWSGRECFISRLFYDDDTVDNIWAIITFKKSNPSLFWLPFGYCQGKFFGPSKDVTVYGYIQQRGQSMLFSKCSASKKHLYCWCFAPMPYYNGGPILNAYQDDSKSGTDQKLPPAFGLSFDYISRDGSYRGYIYNQMALSFDSDIFWSACFLLRKNGFNANCQKLYDVPLGRRKKMHTYRKVILQAN